LFFFSSLRFRKACTQYCKCYTIGARCEYLQTVQQQARATKTKEEKREHEMVEGEEKHMKKKEKEEGKKKGKALLNGSGALELMERPCLSLPLEFLRARGGAAPIRAGPPWPAGSLS
jgi:hypothetical protein